MKLRVWFLILPMILSSCGWFQSKEQNAINIGIIFQDSVKPYDMGLTRGAKIAVQELNAQGGLLGRQVHLIQKNTKTNINDEIIAAKELAQIDNMLAVIGHLRSDGTIPASSIYEQAKVIMLTPTATSNLITENPRNFIFRMVPSDENMAQLLSRYFVSQHYKNVIIFYPRSEYGQDLANYFEKNVTHAGLNIVDRRSYFEQSGNYSDLLSFWMRNYDFDSIFLPGDIPDGPQILNQIRQVGIKVPVISADGMANDQLIKLSGKNAEGLVALDFENLEHFDTKALQSFRNQYMTLYKTEPESNALLGYDAIMLLANAVNKTQSVDNEKVAQYLHQTAYKGFVTEYKFDSYGNNISNINPYLKKVTHGTFTIFDLPKNNKDSKKNNL